MKKIFTCLFIIIVGILFANPIEAEYFSEIYFEVDEWQIELAYTEFFGEWGFDNLDNHRLVTNDGISNFKSGIDLTDLSIIVINQDSLLTNLYIDKISDVVRLEQFINDEWVMIDQIGWGIYQPIILCEGQSLVKMYFDYWGYIRVKDNEPTLGYEPFYSNAQGTLSGRVYDSDNNPISGAEISIIPTFSPDVYTDESGYFEMVDLVTMIYQQLHISYNQFNLDPPGNYYVEPDSTTYYEFILDISNVTDNQYDLNSLITISNYPNPFNPTTEISFSVPLTSSFMTIEIYNSRGQKIRTIPVILSGVEGSATWDGTDEHNKQVPSGVYLYKLVSNGKELAVNKMLLLK